MQPGEWRIGLGGSDHDFSAALMRGHDIRVCIEQERLTRVKQGLSVWFREPTAPAVSYCLGAEGIRLDEVAAIVGSDTLPARTRTAYGDGRLRLYNHHLCHAASAYMAMPCGARAGILVCDGYGSRTDADGGSGERVPRETISFHAISDQGLERLGTTTGSSFREEDDYPVGISNSVGMFYELATSVLGYRAGDTGKTMGLAGHGEPRHAAALMDFVTLGPDRGDCFRCPTDAGEIVAAMEGMLLSGRGGFAARADLAASVQEVFERVLLHCAALLPSDVDCIGLGGGCGLNTVANARLARASGVPVHVAPHCGDAGLGLGALWLSAREDGDRTPSLSFRGRPTSPALSRPGRLYSPAEVASAVAEFHPRLVHDPSVASPADMASLLASGDVIGVVSGRSEIGPRALGGRSILADPRRVAMRERINRELKGREPFRPLAPVIPAAHFDEYFEGPPGDPYMLRTSVARPRCRHEAPAALHVDGTARVQVLEEDADPWLWAVLHAFLGITGTPILVNTSFNRRGEPIVETPADGIDAFLGMRLDGLQLCGAYYRPAGPPGPSD